MTVRELALEEIKLQSGLTAAEIAMRLFGRRFGNPGRVYFALQMLVLAKQIERRGKGGLGDPFRYEIKRQIKRRV